MAKKYYLPATDAGLDEWLDNFNVQLPLVKAALDIKNQEVNKVQNLTDGFKDALNLSTEKEAEKQAAVGQKDASKQALLDFYSPFIQRIKNHENYEEGIHGRLLGIVGAEQVVDTDNLKPKFKIVLDAGRPKLKWQKSVAEALKIFVNRNDAKGFRFLAVDTKPDFIDTTPVPADKDSVVWVYKAIYMINDVSVGKYSNQVSVTVTREVEEQEEPTLTYIIVTTNQSTVQQIEIGLNGTGSFIIEWGDGQSEPATLEGSSVFLNHLYAGTGMYDVTVKGPVSQLTEFHSNSSQLTRVQIPLIATALVLVVLQNNNLSADEVNNILITFNEMGVSNIVINLLGNAAPTGAGLTAKASLQARGCMVLTS